MKKIILFLSIIVTYTTCSQSKKEKNNNDIQQLYININKSNNINNLDKSTFYDISEDILPDFEFTRLETNDSCLVGYVKDIIYHNKNYYIQDEINNCVHCFSHTGKHLFTLNKQGQGPDEYTQIHAFTVDNNNIWIVDNLSFKLICYNQNQKITDCVDLKKYNFQADQIIINNQEVILINNWAGLGSPLYLVLIYDTINKKSYLKKEFSALPPNTILRGMKRQTAISDTTILATFSYCDTIFQIINHNIVPKYKYIFSERMEDTPLNTENYREDTKRINGINALYQTPNNIILEYVDERWTRYAIFKKDGIFLGLYPGFKVQDIGNYILFGMNISDNEIISVFNPGDDFKYYFENEIINQKFKREENKHLLIKESDKIKEGDNPVIFRFTLKNNSNL